MASLFTTVQLSVELYCEFRLQRVASIAQGIHATTGFVVPKLIQ